MSDTKIGDLPLGSAAGTNINDSFPYVNSTTNVTQRLKLSDIFNLPTFQAQFLTLIPSQTGQNGKCLQSNGSNTIWNSCGIGSVTSVSLLDGSTTPIYSVTGSPVTGIGTLTFSLNTQTANRLLASPSTGPPGQPTFRSLVGADLPNPSSSTLGGVQSLASTSHQWINSISILGVPSSTQPAFSDISGTLGVGAGGTGVTSVTTTPTASAWAGWDANKNLSANNFPSGYATNVTAAGTTTLTIASAYQQFFTGTTTQTVVLPVTSTLVNGFSFLVNNLSTGIVTVQSSGGNTISAQASGTTVIYTVILTSGTTAASWSYSNFGGGGGANLPTVQRFASGSGTYTTPANVIYLEVKMIAGGGGGAGSATQAANNGGTGATGGNSTWAVHSGSIFITALGGGGGGGAAGSGGVGGTGTIGAPAIQILNSPGNGGGGSFLDSGVGINPSGAQGGGSALGGGGAVGQYNGGGSSVGTSGITNSGGGGGGGMINAGVGQLNGSGGGGGASIVAIITSPSASYDYAVGASGAGGTAGTSGAAGGPGGSGYIEVTEYYANGAVGTATSVTGTNVVTNTNLSQMPANTIKGNNTGSTANAADLTAPQVAALFTAPTISTVSLSSHNGGFSANGSGTYTTPANVKYFRVRAQGAGGGGGGSGTGGGTGGTGGNTTFGSITASGGSGGPPASGGYVGPAGGAASGGNILNAGGNRAATIIGNNGAAFNTYGGNGADSRFGTGGAGGSNGGGAGQAPPVAETGAGGGGGGGNSAIYAQPGGAAGGYVESFIYPTAGQTFSYGCGAAGTAGGAGTSGGAGGAGTSGQIVIEEFYQ